PSPRRDERIRLHAHRGRRRGRLDRLSRRRDLTPLAPPPRVDTGPGPTDQGEPKMCDCNLSSYDAEALDSRAREAHTFAGISRDPKDREFARDLETRAEEIWDHLIEAHEDRLPEPGEY